MYFPPLALDERRLVSLELDLLDLEDLPDDDRDRRRRLPPEEEPDPEEDLDREDLELPEPEPDPDPDDLEEDRDFVFFLPGFAPAPAFFFFLPPAPPAIEVPPDRKLMALPLDSLEKLLHRRSESLVPIESGAVGMVQFELDEPREPEDDAEYLLEGTRKLRVRLFCGAVRGCSRERCVCFRARLRPLAGINCRCVFFVLCATAAALDFPVLRNPRVRVFMPRVAGLIEGGVPVEARPSLLPRGVC